ncbi:hypothetical protein [Streptomyces scabiei]|uniref:hypothetical protein n=1 Tax=Streptomyces scabiei TaxID=1930 RepID=UPI0029A1E731|nr:hypothetical protein [Streptomyces scabiei]MDX2802675.1 hypothetical protein [Streptomyces scabiei]MDX3277230.1 hypothetical protein [Streptomyces scabiei]
MPKYDDVPETPQLPAGTPSVPKPAEAKDKPMTTDVPEDVQRALRLAAVIHGITIKAAVTEALRDWLVAHPIQLSNSSTPGSK